MIDSSFKSALAAVALALSVGSVATTDAFAWGGYGGGHFGGGRHFGGHFGGHQQFGGGYRRYGGYGYRARPSYAYSGYAYHGPRPVYGSCAYGWHYSPFLHECIVNFRRY